MSSYYCVRVKVLSEWVRESGAGARWRGGGPALTAHTLPASPTATTTAVRDQSDVSLKHTLTRTHTHTLSVTHTPSLSLTHTPSLSVTHSHFRTGICIKHIHDARPITRAHGRAHCAPQKEEE